MKKIKIIVTLIEEMLGMTAADPDIHSDHLARKSADAEKIKEELAALPLETHIEKSMTVFPRNGDGIPIMWDYQLKGAIKEWFRLACDTAKGDIRVGKTKLSNYSHKRICDQFVFPAPRQIPIILPEGGEMGICTRPLRATTLQGDRVALATSETVPPGSTMTLEITTLSDELMPYIIEGLNYGKLRGLGQWRNSGKGRFEWKEVD